MYLESVFCACIYNDDSIAVSMQVEEMLVRRKKMVSTSIILYAYYTYTYVV